MKIDYTVTEAADYLGVSYETLNRWEREGKIVTFKKPSGKKYLTRDILDKVKEGNLTIEEIFRLRAENKLPLEIKVNLDNASKYEEYSDKFTDYYNIQHTSINTTFTDLEVSNLEGKKKYCLGKINKDTGEFISVLEWEE